MSNHQVATNLVFQALSLVLDMLRNGVMFLLLILWQLGSGVLFVFSILYHFLKNKLTNRRKRQLRQHLRQSHVYEEWLEVAQELDKEYHTFGWQIDPTSHFYDHVNIRIIINHLKGLVRGNLMVECAHLLRVLMVRNFSGIANNELYNYTLSGTKTLINEYYETILMSLEAVFNSDIPDKLVYFKDLKHIYGKTGLMFSGGASIGMFHLGVISVLLERNLLPRVFCGSSAGSLMCSLVGTNNDDELRKHALHNFASLDLSPFANVPPKGQLWRKIKRIFKEGHFINKAPLRDFLILNTYNLTFEEAFAKTRRIINITVTDSSHQKFHVLNYLSAPNVYVWSAALASCSLPYVYAPTKIYAKFDDNRTHVWMPAEKMFIDGSIGADIPDRVLSEKFNVTNFIVSQTNVYIVPFLMNSRFYRFSRKFFFFKIWEVISSLFWSELKHRINQLAILGLIPQKYILLLNILTQEYTGNITIFPSLQVGDALRLFDNPCKEKLAEWTLRGRTSTFFCKLISSETHF